mmetsp:Transcript_32077/g.47195  ORF Transcript_32077/g.47195 Transcript_32077/m.47195 type:complete len:742 (+) Transcript_32077:92-2317(+)
MKFLFALTLIIICEEAVPFRNAFSPFQRGPSLSSERSTTCRTSLNVSQLEKKEAESVAIGKGNGHGNGHGHGHGHGGKIPSNLRIRTAENANIEKLDPEFYETSLLKSWEDTSRQVGFDWEMEKLRRYFAGLRVLDDGTWVRKPSFFEFLVSSTSKRSGEDAPTPPGILDVATLMTINILSGIGFGSQLGMAAVPNAVIQKYEGSFFSFITGVLGGDLQALAGGPLFLLLAKYYQEYGGIFNLSFGPKSFLIISDPIMAKHVLRSNPQSYCKGVLAEILEPIMGNGLIPANPKIWKVRRRAIVPAFHKRWLNRMIKLFGECAGNLNDQLEPIASQGTKIDMEERFCSVTLDIIGKSVFNYDFGSVTKESPIVKSVYRVLREAEHRSSSFIPYWNLPYADKWMDGQVEFRKDMTMLDDILTNLINQAVKTRQEATVEELEQRDNDEDPSLLRFLADMRGEDLSSKVLRDDLMTMLIAGHETTAAMLTWTFFELSKGDPGMLNEIQAEVDSVLQNKERPDYDDLVAMPRLRYALIEALRLYPEPPVLIRRARIEDDLPPGGTGLKNGVKVLRGTDIFISTWNLHRSPELWEDPETYDPTRWERKFSNKGIEDWAGYEPDRQSGLYPNEISSDFAFLPFGGGQRKCVGDQFAMLEATVTASMLLKNYEFSFAIDPEDVGMQTGATIHTMNGLQMYVRKRPSNEVTVSDGWWEKQHLSRGLSTNGKPYSTKEDAAWETNSRTATP